ncbi:IST1 homolog isoform X3 [Lithobates pipiens]
MSALLDMFKKNVKPQTIASSLQNTQRKLRQVVANKSEERKKITKEIVDCMTSGNTERAKIKVIPVIREDNRIYAMEILETYCGLLYQQAGLIESSRQVDKSLVEAVSTLIWASPRFEMEIPELKEVAALLGSTYGKDFVEKCRDNQCRAVSQVVKKKLEVDLPHPYMVEKYLSEIALECKKVYIPKEPIPVETAADANAALCNIYGEMQFQDPAAGAGSIYEQPTCEAPESELLRLSNNFQGKIHRQEILPEWLNPPSKQTWLLPGTVFMMRAILMKRSNNHLKRPDGTILHDLILCDIENLFTKYMKTRKFNLIRNYFVATTYPPYQPLSVLHPPPPISTLTSIQCPPPLYQSLH